MRLTPALLKQNIAWHFKMHWAQQKKRKIIETGAKKVLAAKKIPVYNPEDIVGEERKIEKIEVIGMRPKPIPLDNTHPNWHDRVLLTYNDDNVLLDGLTQAKILTKTVELKQGLPDTIQLQDSKKYDELVKRIILATHVFDAEQKKLPVVKDPLRPMWNFPRTYGITQERINKLLIAKLMHLLEATNDLSLARERYLFNNMFFSFNFEKYGELVQLQLRADSLLASSKPLSNITDELTDSFELPDIYPIKATVTLNPENIYEIRNIYSIKPDVTKSHPHTVFVHYNKEEVKNLYEEPVTDQQVLGRSLLKAFTVAASYAKQRFGNEIRELPKPVTVQCVQTDGQLFDFGILQLNTLNLEGDDGIKNIWYQSERIPLFDKCCYIVGRPVLEGYNKQVIQILNAFYNRV